MKSVIRIIAVLLSAASLGLSEEEINPVSPESATTLATRTTPRLLGKIPDGTPPPLALPKPEFLVPAQDILETTSHEQGGRTITIRQIKPIDLPPPPAPVELVPAEVDAEFSQHLAEYRQEHPRSNLLFLGATVYRSKDSAPRTLVRWWPIEGGKTITYWSSADFALIAGGITSYVDSAANSHHLFMAWGSVDIDRMSDPRTEKGLEFNMPEIPDLPEGKATFQIVGEQPAAKDLVALQSLHDLYNSEFERLKTAYEGREQARLEQEAYLKANPLQPKNITLNYWRTEKPASSQKGGGAR